MSREPDPSTPSLATHGPSRRNLLVGAGVLAAATAVTSACGASGGGDDGGGGAATTPGGGGTTVKTSDVPLNGGTILQAQQIVVTQPQAGTYKAFSAICTHQGCLVTSVDSNVIQCPCHGAQFSAVDGAVESGPAQQALPSVALTVSGDTITLT